MNQSNDGRFSYHAEEIIKNMDKQFQNDDGNSQKKEEIEWQPSNRDASIKINISRNSANVSIELSCSENKLEAMEPLMKRWIAFLDDFVYEYENEDMEPTFSDNGGEINPVEIGSIDELYDRLNFKDIAELIHLQKYKYSDVDLVLLAGSFAQLNSMDAFFTTSDVNRLISLTKLPKLKNASHCIKLNLDSKRLENKGKKFQLTESGMERILNSFAPIFTLY